MTYGTRLVGILNLTPDSFSDGGLYNDQAAALQQAERLFNEGASLVDVGAESTRPGARPLSDVQEWQRLEAVLPVLLREYPGRISLDSYHPATVARALRFGPVIVNDITGLQDPAIFNLVTGHSLTVVVTHLPATDAQTAHRQEPLDAIQTVRDDLLAAAKRLLAAGMTRAQILLDPGIGFGKTAELNHQLLRFAEQVPDYHVMIGHSRKRFLGEHRLEAGPNLAAARAAIDSGAAYLRVHDVKLYTGLPGIFCEG